MKGWARWIWIGWLLAPAPAALAWAPHLTGVAASVGVSDLLERQEAAAAAVETRWTPFRVPWVAGELPVEPAVGAVVDDRGATYVYAGLRLDLAESWERWRAARHGEGGAAPVRSSSRRWHATAFTGAGGYSAGEGKELGGTLEFRSGLELAWQVRPGARLEVTFFHLSNAGIYGHNPGSEGLMLGWSWRP